ncbi:Myosin heavy chain, clone like [Actinidia chinensis var. chinensis]|uniref:Myosin heavy chain, clone like n=1 Tax=Actinidia chinensis var. chinensis TaxID=1590841 RepID=A0A2R6PCY3_ACTCC|nr:Myosin heavy chain, clone like [Actinidia chinensis var. chinensis]
MLIMHGVSGKVLSVCPYMSWPEETNYFTYIHDYLQDQLNARNEKVYCRSEHVRGLKLKVTELDNLEEKFGGLTEELNRSNAERLIKELESKDVEFQNSASCIEKLEESVSCVALEDQCEMESMRLDLMALEQSSFEAKKFQEEAAQEKARMNGLIQDLELQIQNERKNSESLNKENDDLREKLDESEINARIFCQKIEE